MGNEDVFMNLVSLGKRIQPSLILRFGILVHVLESIPHALKEIINVVLAISIIGLWIELHISYFIMSWNHV